MNIDYFHASKFGNGAQVAAEFKRRMGARGVAVDVHHISDVDAADLPLADLYVFSSPGRMGRPIRAMRRFLKDIALPAGTRYAVLTTELATKTDKKTGEVPACSKWQRVIPLMVETLDGKGLVRVATDRVHVRDVKGPLEDGWQAVVDEFAARLADTRPSALR